MIKFTAAVLAATTTAVTVSDQASNAIIQLSQLNVGDLTVSGISSGGYMAVQFHVSYSSAINGAAIFAGGPFYCA